MDSEDDMHDANDDDFYSGDTAGDSDDANDADYDFIGHDSDDTDHIISYRHQVPILLKFIELLNLSHNIDWIAFFFQVFVCVIND